MLKNSSEKDKWKIRNVNIVVKMCNIFKRSLWNEEIKNVYLLNVIIKCRVIDCFQFCWTVKLIC